MESFKDSGRLESLDSTEDRVAKSYFDPGRDKYGSLGGSESGGSGDDEWGLRREPIHRQTCLWKYPNSSLVCLMPERFVLCIMTV